MPNKILFASLDRTVPMAYRRVALRNPSLDVSLDGSSWLSWLNDPAHYLIPAGWGQEFTMLLVNNPNTPTECLRYGFTEQQQGFVVAGMFNASTPRSNNVPIARLHTWVKDAYDRNLQDYDDLLIKALGALIYRQEEWRQFILKDYDDDTRATLAQLPLDYLFELAKLDVPQAQFNRVEHIITHEWLGGSNA